MVIFNAINALKEKKKDILNPVTPYSGEQSEIKGFFNNSIYKDINLQCKGS